MLFPFITGPVQRLCFLTVVAMSLISSPVAAAGFPLPPRLHAAAFDHSAFDELLRGHVVNGMVDYDAFQRSPLFATYLTALAAFDPARLGTLDQLAFWINAYNAYTIQLINEHRERESIRNIDKSLGFLKLKGPWREPLAVVGGRPYTLDAIEHDIIRKRFAEPRIHFALVCAAMGCPPLRSEAYAGDRLTAQLDDQARLFLRQSPAKNRVDTRTRTVYVSMIFNRYKNDFGGTDASVGQFIGRWYAEGPEKTLLESGRFRLEQTAYDWTLNSQAKARIRP
ncbi:MAG: DUF547 domain-containing protein [Gemmatimonadaceae bacterium]